MNNSPIAVLGAHGMLGSDLMEELADRRIACHGIDVDECDVTDAHQCEELLSHLRPAAVVNCAAYTDVNGAEKERERAFSINGNGAANIARACAQVNARCLYISTDYVFDGTKTEPYVESDTPNPVNAYGASKLEGERMTSGLAPDHAIVRTSWLYGRRGKSFPRAILTPTPNGVRHVVADQVGAPTYTRDLAVALIELATRTETGIFHRTNAGSCSWYEFARKILDASGKTDIQVVPVQSRGYHSPARRPANSRLSDTRLCALGVAPLPPWEDALERFLKEIAKE